MLCIFTFWVWTSTRALIFLLAKTNIVHKNRIFLYEKLTHVHHIQTNHRQIRRKMHTATVFIWLVIQSVLRNMHRAVGSEIVLFFFSAPGLNENKSLTITSRVYAVFLWSNGFFSTFHISASLGSHNVVVPNIKPKKMKI